MPDALVAAVRDRFLLDPRDLIDDPDIPSCTNDADCATSWPWGTGHRCKAVGGRNERWIQIDVDRVNMRPEGVELVLFENDEDPQSALFSETSRGPTFEAFLCGPERLGDVLARDAVTTNLRSFSLSPDLTIDEICGEGHSRTPAHRPGIFMPLSRTTTFFDSGDRMRTTITL